MRTQHLIRAGTGTVLSVVGAMAVALLASCEPPVVADFTTNRAVFRANDYLKERYFFLDNTYRRYYIKKYAPQGSTPIAPPKVKELSVWRLYNRILTENKTTIKPVIVDTIDQLYLFERLDRDKHYFLDPDEGYIRFADSISFLAEQQVAIFMRTVDAENPANASMQKGSFQIAQEADSIRNIKVGDTLWHLWTIRPREPIQTADDDTSRFFLMWRTVYGPMDFSDPTSFRLSVRRIDPGTDERHERTGSTFIADILGLTSNNVPKIHNLMIYNNTFNDLIIPPYDTSFYGLEPFNNPSLGEYRDSLIYRYAADHPKLKMSSLTLWEIETTTRRYITD